MDRFGRAPKTAAAGRTPGRDLLEPLERALSWQLSLADGDQRLICPDHRIEHTGKSACTAILALELARWVRDDRLVDAAVAQGFRLVKNLVREGTSPCHTFRPGRHDPFNCSNSVIDGGACSDALASLVETLGERLPATTREAFAEASLLHARTYLRYAVLDKGIPAQRAWGLTGLAAAARLERAGYGANGAEPGVLERASMEAVGVLEAIQNPDGSFPYHPLEWGAGHPGAADVSAFYQSRVSGFVLHALESLGRDPADPLFRGPLLRGLHFTAALQGVDGIKCGLVEAKPWYWGASYEVASHPFDVHAFASGWRVFSSAVFARAAHRAQATWAAHLAPNGQPRSHLAGPGREASYQCPLFWAAHACWSARALADLEASRDALGAVEPGTGKLELSVLWFPSAQLGRVEDGKVLAWVRGSRPPGNALHGSPHGNGLLRVQRRSDGVDLLERCRLGGHQEGEWNGKAGGLSPLRGWRSGGGEMRFSLWLARVAQRRSGLLGALGVPLRVFRRAVAAPAHPRVSSAFARAAEVSVHGDGIELAGPLAWRDGAPIPGSRVVRSYRVDGEGLEVRERLLSPGGARSVGLAVPRAATHVEVAQGEVRYRLG